LHRLLKRQIKKSFGHLEFDKFDAQFLNFIDLIEHTYHNFDLDKKLMEHTLTTNTKELVELNHQIEHESEVRLKELIEQAPYGFILISEDGEISDVNQFTCNILNCKKNLLLTLTAEELFDKFEKLNFFQIRDKVLKSGENIFYEDNFTKCEGIQVPVELTIGKLVIRDKIHILVMFHDISERVAKYQEIERLSIHIQKLNEELKSKNKILEKDLEESIKKNFEKDQLLIQQSKLAAMGDMMGNIAHQWRQPLNTLAIAVQDIEEAYLFDDLDEAYLKTFVDLAMENITYMSKTIDDFRNFFKPSKQKEYFYLRESVDDIMKIVSAQLKNHNIEMIIKGENRKVYGYPNEFKQVIMNLTNNAKDAILENKIENGIIEINTGTHSSRFEKISVKDNGGGVPIEIINKIFEPYFTTKEGNKGTGIGLYMSKIIIEQNMMGKLLLENHENGALFTILIPSVEYSYKIIKQEKDKNNQYT